MNTMKSFMLVGVAALSLGVGATVAQQGMGGTSVRFYRAPQALTTQAPGIVQTGSSDVDTTRPESPYPGAHSGLFTFGP